ncbi:MAG: hypothetical protein WC503_00785 [Candidatus Shapirobacteria bacterium]
MWLKIWRDSSAMAGRPHYAEYETENDIEGLIDYFDEMIYGDGYHYIEWEKIDKPPIEWLKKEIQRKAETLKNLYANYKENRHNLQEFIKHYKSLIKS